MSTRPSDTLRRARGVQAEFAQQMRERGYSESQIRASTPRSPRVAVASGAHLVSVSGRRIALTNPGPADFTAGDIAHGLSHVCRFSGQVRQFYSVAQHSIMVASLVPARLRRHALIHDASEAYLQDVPSPLKALLPEYSLLEARFQLAIEASFGLPPLGHEDCAEIKRADMIAVSVEMRDLFDGHFEGDRGALPDVPAGLRVEACLPPTEAKIAFLEELAAS